MPTTTNPALAQPNPGNWVCNVSKKERSLNLFNREWLDMYKGLYAGDAVVDGLVTPNPLYYGLYDLSMKANKR